MHIRKLKDRWKSELAADNQSAQFEIDDLLEWFDSFENVGGARGSCEKSRDVGDVVSKETYAIEKAFLVDECALVKLSLKFGCQLDFGLCHDGCCFFKDEISEYYKTTT